MWNSVSFFHHQCHKGKLTSGPQVAVDQLGAGRDYEVLQFGAVVKASSELTSECKGGWGGGWTEVAS